MRLECFNCHRIVPSEEYVIINYKGYDMFVCKECEKDLSTSPAPSPDPSKPL